MYVAILRERTFLYAGVLRERTFLYAGVLRGELFASCCIMGVSFGYVAVSRGRTLCMLLYWKSEPCNMLRY